MDSPNEDLHDDLLDWAMIGASRMARGFTDFESWSRAMLVEEHSESIRPFLPVIFDNSKKILERTENIFDAAEERRQKLATQRPDDTETVPLWRLTAEQRQQIYEEEKQRLARASPALSAKNKIIVGVYLLGCALLYFGVAAAVIDFWSTHAWELKPEPEFFESFVEAGVTLIRPFLAVVLTFWAVAIPPGIVWGLWLWGADIVAFFKRLLNRGND